MEILPGESTLKHKLRPDENWLPTGYTHLYPQILWIVCRCREIALVFVDTFLTLGLFLPTLRDFVRGVQSVDIYPDGMATASPVKYRINCFILNPNIDA